MAVLPYSDFWIADPDGAGFPNAPTVRLVDLNELEQDCVTGFGIVDEPRFAEDNQEAVLLGQYGHDGDVLGARRHGNQTLLFRLMYKHESTEAIRQAVRDLAAAMDTHGVLVYQLRGTADPVYYDFVPSQLPALFRGGQNGLERLTRALQSPDGVQLAVSAHPFPRGAQVTGELGSVSNEVGARHVRVTNPGNRDGEVIARITPVQAGVSLALVRYGIRSHGDLDEFATIYSAASAGATMKVDTASAAVGDATAGNAAVTDFATNESMARRFRDVRTVTDPTALEGTFRLIARLRATGGTGGTTRHRVQGRYGFSGQDVTPIVLRSVRLDWRDVSVERFVDVDLGLLQVPGGCTRLVLEFWAERLVGDQSLAVDQLVLIPADEHQAVVAVPGFRLGAWGQTRYMAEELDGTGELARDAFVLNASGEIARIKPTNGVQLPAGIHSVAADVSIKEPNDAESTIGRLEVVEDPGGTPSTIHALALRNKKERLWTRRNRALFFEVTAADAAANTRYRFQVRHSAGTQNKRKIRVLEIVHRFLEAIATDSTLVLDSQNRTAQVETVAGVPDFGAVHENELPKAKPGDAVWVFSLLDAPVDPGYDDADEREPLGRSVLARSCSVQIDVLPRFTH